VRDIFGLYLHPPDKALVLCLDEKTRIQSLDRSQPLLPIRPGQAERRIHDYVRHGSTSRFAALELKSGRVAGDSHARHRSVEFRKFLDRIEAAVPNELDVHLLLDNYGTLKTPLIHRWLARHPRFHVHFTPTSASWLNLVERWFATLTRKQIRRGVHRSTRELEEAIRRFIETTNHRPKPFVWTKSADEILASVSRFYKRTSDSRHEVAALNQAVRAGLLAGRLNMEQNHRPQRLEEGKRARPSLGHRDTESEPQSRPDHHSIRPHFFTWTNRF
jgi:transposase